MPASIFLKPDYAVVCRIEVWPKRSKVCNYASTPELYIDDLWNNLYTLLANAGDSGAWACDAPWEISLAYAEKTFINSHGFWGAFPDHDTIPCGEYDDHSWNKAFLQNFVFEGGE
jgi:hypothetical protein